MSGRTVTYPPKAKNATPSVEKSDDWVMDERVVYGMRDN